jgi:hypothetical protein
MKSVVLVLLSIDVEDFVDLEHTYFAQENLTDSKVNALDVVLVELEAELTRVDGRCCRGRGDDSANSRRTWPPHKMRRPGANFQTWLQRRASTHVRTASCASRKESTR